MIVLVLFVVAMFLWFLSLTPLAAPYIVLVLFVVAMFLWFLSLTPPAAPYVAGRPWIAWICVLLLGVYVFVPGLRG
jgi:hypothetical protein